jgi:hypothetical protein
MNRILFFIFLLTTIVACNPKLTTTNRQLHTPKIQDKNAREEREEVADAMDQWAYTRTFPDGIFHSENLETAYNQRETQLLMEADPYTIPSPSKSLGPANIAGRMLCLAFHPTDSLVLWAGSASGGLWKSTTGGLGANAWKRIKTGFPVLGVASIAVAPDGKTIYVGTGEVYGYRNTIGGIGGIRTQRGSYGIGILKSEDGGLTWSKSIDWAENNLRGVQKIVLNPRRPSTVFAATTEGVYRSYDAGQNWTLVNPTLMVVDLDIAPNDTNRIYCTFGSLNNPQNGIFRSLNGGTTWTKLTVGLPTTYSGKALLTIAPSEPNVLFASIAEAEQQIGLFKSTNGGDTWTLLNANNIAQYQGWYSHDVAVHPQSPNFVVHVGINAVISADGGTRFGTMSTSNDIPFGRAVETVGSYMHADIHAVYFSPFNPNKTYFLTDGGIYKNDNIKAYTPSYDFSFQQLNGGLQTTQFYASFSNSQQDANFAIGGMQDNWTAIYDGQPNWNRVIGGDGMNTAIYPKNDSISFGSYQYLGIVRTKNRGEYFENVALNQNIGNTVFNAPFVIAPSKPTVMYAGSERILRSKDLGLTFSSNIPPIDSANSINAIAVNPRRDSSLFVATFPMVTSVAKLFKTTQAGENPIRVQGLPNRVFTDIAIDQKDTNNVFVTLGGFGTAHLYKSTNGGLSFQETGIGLPDVPTNTVLLDSADQRFVYVGNDLGVYYSTDSGKYFIPFRSLGLPDVCLVMDLSISIKNRQLRVATHGNGVYETDLLQYWGIIDQFWNFSASAYQAISNAPIKADFVYIKTVARDTIGQDLNTRQSNARLPSLRANVSDYPYPHPLADVPFIDTLFDYKISPRRTTSKRGGVTTLDIAIIARSILGTDTVLSSNPYKMVAADISGDGTIDGVDMLLLRRFILNVDTQFRLVPHWVFIPKAYTLPATPPRLSEILQSYYVNPNALGNPNLFDFWAVKIGDVNNSYDASFDGIREAPNDQVLTRSEGLTLTTDNIFLEEGTIYDIPIKASKSTTCMGFQGTFCLKNALYTEGVSFIDLESSTLDYFDKNNFNASKTGQIAFSWNANKNQELDTKNPLLTLRFKAQKSGQLSDILQLNSDITPALFFDEKGIEKTVSLKFEKANPNFTVEVQPNPFSDVLNIKIGSVIARNEATEGSLSYSIFDNSGKLLHKNQGTIKKGSTVLSLNAASVNMIQSGVYFLKIEMEGGVKTVKIVKI